MGLMGVARAPRWSSRERILRFRRERLRRLVTHAYENVPYYRRLFDRAGLRPADIREESDLREIPVTDKADLQALPTEDLVARGFAAHRLVERRTSGSTGRPFTIRRTWMEERILNALRRREFGRVGLRATDLMTSVGVVVPSHPRDHQWPQRLLHALGLLRRRSVDCFLPPEVALDRLAELRPDVVIGYPGVLAELAVAARPGALSWSPRLVLVAGEVLTPAMRSRISRGFAAPVREYYGSHEFLLLACECPLTEDLHTCDDGVLLEVVRDGRPVAPGEQGEVVATALHSFAMPLLRFRLGDVATQGEDRCRCGYPFATIRAVEGRTLDYFELPSGRRLHPYEIARVLVGKECAWVRRYQLVQERRDRVIARLEAFETPDENRLAALRSAARQLLGDDVEFDIQLVPAIEPAANGKFRVASSLVGSERKHSAG